MEFSTDLDSGMEWNGMEGNGNNDPTLAGDGEREVSARFQHHGTDTGPPCHKRREPMGMHPLVGRTSSGGG